MLEEFKATWQLMESSFVEALLMTMAIALVSAPFFHRMRCRDRQLDEFERRHFRL